MARRPRQDEERSMDSLMDAMTNVVGILLLILIVSSLGITAAVKEIMENMPEITEEQLAAMKSSRKKTLDNLQDLQSTQSSVEASKIAPDEASQLALDLEKFEKENSDLASKTSDLQELLAKSKELEPVKEEKEDRNTQTVKELNELEQALAAKPLVEAPPAREITLPDPRPADPEAFVYYVACKNQKLYVIGEPYELMVKMRDVLDSKFTDLVYRDGELGSYVFNLNSTKKDDKDKPAPFSEDFQARTKRAKEGLAFMKGVQGKNLKTGKSVYEWVFGGNEQAQEEKKNFPIQKMRLDQKKVNAFFASTKGKGPLDFTPSYGNDGAIKISISMNPEKGLTEKEFLSGDSEFAQLIKKAGANRRVVIMYYVASDSFNTYLRARDYSTSQRIPAGWKLWDQDSIGDLVPNKQRETIPNDIAAIPEGDYLKVAQFVGPKLATKVNAAVDGHQAALDAVKPPAELKGPELQAFKDGLKSHRDEWTNGLLWDLLNLYKAPLAASKADKREDVLVQFHPPYIPHVRTFNKKNPPNAPKPPKTNTPKTKGKTGPSLILD